MRILPRRPWFRRRDPDALTQLRRSRRLLEAVRDDMTRGGQQQPDRTVPPPRNQSDPPPRSA